MLKKTMKATALGAMTSLMLLAGGSWAQSPAPIYGSQLMTQQERNEYRERLRTAKTAEERERIMAENHERMEERAKQRGVTIPDEPPARAGRPGGGMGPGGGGGPGGGMGSGAGGGRSR